MSLNFDDSLAGDGYYTWQYFWREIGITRGSDWRDQTADTWQ